MTSDIPQQTELPTHEVLNKSSALRVQAAIARQEFSKLLDILEEVISITTEDSPNPHDPSITPNLPPEPPLLYPPPLTTSPEKSIITPSTYSTTMGAHSMKPEPLTDEEIATSNANLATRIDALVDALKKKAVKTEVETVQRKSWLAIAGIYGIWVFEIALVLYVLHVSNKADARSSCQSRVNAQTSAALTQRASASAKITSAQDDFLSVILTPGLTTLEKQTALVTYHTVVHDAIVQRDAHPIPTETCG